MVCEHKQVLAIYCDDKHTRDNIHHYRCVDDCGRTDEKPFGKKIIYDDENIDDENIKQHIISGLEEVKDLFEVIPTTENIKEQVKQIEHEFYEIARHLNIVLEEKIITGEKIKVYGDKDYAEHLDKTKYKDEQPRDKTKDKEFVLTKEEFDLGIGMAKKKSKREILNIIENMREKDKKNLVEGEYKDGYLDGLGLLWIDINYDTGIN